MLALNHQVLNTSSAIAAPPLKLKFTHRQRRRIVKPLHDQWVCRRNSNSTSTSTIRAAFPGDGKDLATLVDGPILKVYAPAVVVLGTLMLIDAAYSGDWSRIGVITKQQEIELQSIIPFEAVGHSVCAVAAGAISAQRGEERWALRALKAFAGGVVSLVEVILLPSKAQVDGKI